jgi:hypothetical protein
MPIPAVWKSIDVKGSSDRIEASIPAPRADPSVLAILSRKQYRYLSMIAACDGSPISDLAQACV